MLSPLYIRRSWFLVGSFSVLSAPIPWFEADRSPIPVIRKDEEGTFADPAENKNRTLLKSMVCTDLSKSPIYYQMKRGLMFEKSRDMSNPAPIEKSLVRTSPLTLPRRLAAPVVPSHRSLRAALGARYVRTRPRPGGSGWFVGFGFGALGCGRAFRLWTPCPLGHGTHRDVSAMR